MEFTLAVPGTHITSSLTQRRWTRPCVLQLPVQWHMTKSCQGTIWKYLQLQCFNRFQHFLQHFATHRNVCHHPLLPSFPRLQFASTAGHQASFFWVLRSGWASWLSLKCWLCFCFLTFFNQRSSAILPLPGLTWESVQEPALCDCDVGS